MKRAVVTYIFGRGKELLREPLKVDEDIEYICVTDQKYLKSKIWKIVYDEIPQAGCVRDKMVYVKYCPFKYTTADEICVIDGSMEIKNSLIPLFEQLDGNDILVKAHPDRNNLLDELHAWIRMRHMPGEYVKKFEMMASHENISLKTNFLIESCVMLYKNNEKVNELCKMVISLMSFLGNAPCLFLSNQICLTFLLQTFFKCIRFAWLSQVNFFNRYRHNTRNLNPKYNN
jgi:hypothetical protein